MKKLVCVLLLIALGAPAFAAEPVAPGVVQDFLRLSQAKEKYEASMIASCDVLGQMPDISMLPEEQRARIEKMQKIMKDFMLKEMGWDKVKDDFAKIYSELYTEKEMLDTIKLLQNPVAQKMIAKEIKMMPEAMKINQKLTREIMPKLMELMQSQLAPPAAPAAPAASPAAPPEKP